MGCIMLNRISWALLIGAAFSAGATAQVAHAPAGSEAAKAGTVFRDCAACPEMVTVPAGKLLMGSPPDEPGRYANEGPQQSITIGKPFAVGRYSVTFDEWDACASSGGCNAYKPDDSGWGRGRMPVINVSWKDATSYVAWLSKTSGKTYRLPSEAEREYVTRAGTTTYFWFGANIKPSISNYNYLQNARYGGDIGEPLRRTVKVDAFAPNPWGLFNVHGNVWEWTEDCWSSDLVGTPGDGSARVVAECDRRVVRGGGFGDFPRIVRSAARLSYGEDSRFQSIGFRVVRNLAP
ncbi:MAG: formylglycine-generating enzyme family protein [Hyphomicrobiaceae bacterium]|nr:formylglycine-generating enzyme family protein [Hyphomicrobiaceae bacterium]